MNTISLRIYYDFTSSGINTDDLMLSKDVLNDGNTIIKEVGQFLANAPFASGKYVVQVGEDIKLGYTVTPRSGNKFITKTYSNGEFEKQYALNYPKSYLTCVKAEEWTDKQGNKKVTNNYKFYQLEQVGDKCHCTYGRMGETSGRFAPKTYDYDLDMYWVKYFEKLSKGYVDRSEQYLEEEEKLPVGERKVDNIAQRLYDKLYRIAKQVIETNLKVTRITPTMASDSREIYNRLVALAEADEDNVLEFNKELLNLLAIAPRQVNSVNELLAVDVDDYPDILNREDNIIGAMESMVAQNDGRAITPNMDDFKAVGIEIYEASNEQKQKVMAKLSSELQPKVKTVYRVIDSVKKQRFDEYVKKNKITSIKELWHGSKNENWLSIMINGLLLRPNAQITGKMFGDGIYFAPSSMKSWGYTSYRGTHWANGTSDTAYMGIYATAYGNPHHPTTWGSQYNQSMLSKVGCNCVHAEASTCGLRNDEIIFYSEDAMVLNYIVEFEG